METLILAIVCIVLMFILYVVTGGWKKYGGLFGIWKWIRASIKSSAPPSSLIAPQKEIGREDAQADEAVRVLREIYVEFDNRQSRLERQLTLLTENQARLQAQVEALLAQQSQIQTGPKIASHTVERDTLQSVTEPSAAPADSFPTGTQMAALETVDGWAKQQPEQTGRGERVKRSDVAVEPQQPAANEDTYFAILDLLAAGRTLAQIAAELHVPEAHVAYVQQIMAEPTRE
ncbi:hypothetical protein [Alicyclobacillus fodiniaquatilis]|jgi:hypothetical protein|uniref:DUF2802 domain-containing protein n=1 Tax=Alicyclobacillus fodiniaquatilis TaxID=1661150 RepID=A0ABW4JHQ0_9BACL